MEHGLRILEKTFELSWPGPTSGPLRNKSHQPERRTTQPPKLATETTRGTNLHPQSPPEGNLRAVHVAAPCLHGIGRTDIPPPCPPDRAPNCHLGPSGPPSLAFGCVIHTGGGVGIFVTNIKVSGPGLKIKRLSCFVPVPVQTQMPAGTAYIRSKPAVAKVTDPGKCAGKLSWAGQPRRRTWPLRSPLSVTTPEGV